MELNYRPVLIKYPMKNQFNFTIIIPVLLFFSLLTFTTSCEETSEMVDDTVVEHRKSPIVISSAAHEGTYIKVVYGQPYKRGRAIFGELEPFGDVWRTGANEATEITITDDVLMDGNPVDADTYALFTIPQEDEWTVILNTALGQWGAFDYDEEQDYLRFNRPARETETVIEAMTIAFDEVENGRTTLYIAWDNTKIEIPIEFL